MNQPKETRAGRLLQLSEDVSRIAGSLAQMSVGFRGPTQQDPPITNSNEPSVLLETVSGLIEDRRNRAAYLPADLFAEPAWDILLNLFRSDLADERVTVPGACDWAGVPASNALRWISTLERHGLVLREVDQGDSMSASIVLAPATRNALRRYCLDIVETHRGRCQ